MKKPITILILLIIISVRSFGQSQKKYSAKEVKADLEYLKDALEASNYDFYAFK